MQNSEYKELPLNEDLEKRKEYWEIGKGLQKVDSLDTSEYLERVIEGTLEGNYNTTVAVEKVGKYYENVGPEDAGYENKEADMAAARITLILEKGGFRFSPSTLLSIHQELFHDILPYKWVGVFRTVNITKSEDILNGRSVQYVNYEDIRNTLKYDFEDEEAMRYKLPFTENQVSHLAKFVSNAWQVHPFREGNTRTIATFLILYLRNIGIGINSEPFKDNALFFRNALVRANYSSIRDGINADSSFLIMFFENILRDAGHDLLSMDLRCKELF